MPSPIERQYYRPELFESILEKLQEQGIVIVTRKDISGVDEYHVRGAEVSLELAREAGFAKNTKVIDIGCGIGGPCRMLAEEYGCIVTGVDITEEFVRTARLLSGLTGLDELTSFVRADALHLPFADAVFDVAWTQHVQMNIENKSTFYAEMKRVLAGGGRFIYYDIFKRNDQPLYFPVPWADEASLNFLMTVQELDEILIQLGFKKISTTDQTEKAKEFLTLLLDKMAKGNISRVALSLVIGISAKQKFENLLRSLQEGRIELQSGIYQKQ